MFKQCLSFPEYQVRALRQLGFVYKAQDDADRAIEHFRMAFEEENDYQTASQIGQLYAA